MGTRQVGLEENPIDTAKLALIAAAAGPGPVLIYTHDGPDPDALAAGSALAVLLRQAWQIESHLTYSGIVARAENRAMLEYLTPEWQKVEILTVGGQYSAIAMVDSQPGAGNHRLPVEVAPRIVVDHHKPLREELSAVQYVDVRPEIGSTSTMLYQYLAAAGIQPDSNLATALFYGLQTDTRGLARGGGPEDEAVYLQLLGKLDRKKLIAVEQAGLPRTYYQALSQGLHAARIHPPVIVANLAELHRPDFAAEMADVLIRLENIKAVLCHGIHADTICLSLRTRSGSPDAGSLVQQVVANLGKAGGHGSIAGGQISLAGRDPAHVSHLIEERFLSMMNASRQGEILLENQRTL